MVAQPGASLSWGAARLPLLFVVATLLLAVSFNMKRSQSGFTTGQAAAAWLVRLRVVSVRHRAGRRARRRVVNEM